MKTFTKNFGHHLRRDQLVIFVVAEVVAEFYWKLFSFKIN